MQKLCAHSFMNVIPIIMACFIHITELLEICLAMFRESQFFSKSFAMVTDSKS